jgi:DNA-binding MarR family transcriptional regulator
MSDQGLSPLTEDTVSKAEYEALATFRYLIRQFLHFSEQAAKSIGLTPQQHQALLAIQGFPEREMITISELAERLKIRHHSAVGLVDRLVDQQLVTRIPVPEDQRKVYVRLTAHGLTTLDRLGGPHRAELRRIEPQLRQLLAALAPAAEQANAGAESDERLQATQGLEAE